MPAIDFAEESRFGTKGLHEGAGEQAASAWQPYGD
jgi:hypothetical protein